MTRGVCRRTTAGLLLASVIVSGCHDSSWTRLKREYPAASAVFQAGMIVGGAPAAIALAPITVPIGLLAFEGNVRAWTLIAAGGIPTGAVVGVLLGLPTLLVEKLVYAFQIVSWPSHPFSGEEVEVNTEPDAPSRLDSIPTDLRIEVNERVSAHTPLDVILPDEDEVVVEIERPDGQGVRRVVLRREVGTPAGAGHGVGWRSHYVIDARHD